MPPGRKIKQRNQKEKDYRVLSQMSNRNKQKNPFNPTQNFHAAYSKDLFVRTASSAAAAAAAAGREKVPHRTRGLRRSFSLNMSSASRFSMSLVPIPPPSAENTPQKTKPPLACLLPLFASLVSSSLDLWSRRHATPKSSSKKLQMMIPIKGDPAAAAAATSNAWRRRKTTPNWIAQFCENPNRKSDSVNHKLWSRSVNSLASCEILLIQIQQDHLASHVLLHFLVEQTDGERGRAHARERERQRNGFTLQIWFYRIFRALWLVISETSARRSVHTVSNG